MPLIDYLRAKETSLRGRLRRAGGSMAARLLPPGLLPGTLDQRVRRRLAAEAAPMVVHEAGSGNKGRTRKALLVSQDMSASGAPALLLEIARTLVNAGWDVAVWSLAPGSMVERFTAAGIPVVVDHVPGLRRVAPSLAGVVDVVICNTIATQSAVKALSPHLPVLWYLHEVSALEALVDRRAFAHMLAMPRFIWAGSELSARVVRRHRSDIRVVPYGLAPIASEPLDPVRPGEPARLAVFGSYEARKGQDLLVGAFARLSMQERALLTISLYGRVLDAEFHARLQDMAAPHPQIELGGELTLADYHARLVAADAVVVPSRDDTLPLVSLDALGAGRILMCTATTGTAAYLTDGQDGFVAGDPTEEALADMLRTALADRARWPDIAREGRAVFDRAFSADAFADTLLVTCASMAATGRI